MINTSQVAGTPQILIKQKVVDESYNYSYNITKGSHNMYDEYIPDVLLKEPNQNLGIPSYIIPETINQGNSHDMIKQDVFDEGDIEVLTPVWMY